MFLVVETPSLRYNGSRSDSPVNLGPSALAALESEPTFPDFVRRAAAISVESYHGRWMLNRLLNDRGRFIASLIMLDLHFTSADGGGFTAAQLRREVADLGLCSPGRITAFLATLRLAGFVAPVASSDRRTQRLAPTEALLSMHRMRWSVQFAMLAELRPEARGAAEALADPTFIGHCAHALMEAFRRGERLFAYVPALEPIAERDAGVTMLMSLLVAKPDQSVTITKLAHRFSVARSHVRETLRAAELEGLVCAGEERGRYLPGPALAPTIARFFSVVFLIFLQAFVTARAQGWDIGEPPRTPTA
jgi:DNA-binding transcriptional ArsR family regulator